MLKKIALLAGLCVSATSFAGSLGVYGTVWEIQETDVIRLLEQKAAEYEKNGKGKEALAKAREVLKQRIENPKPIAGIKNAIQARKYYYDPSFVTEKDIVDHRGNIVVPAGIRVNPAQALPLSKPLIFIDARDSRQVEWAENFVAKEPRTKTILVAGPLLELQRKYHRPLYYDQAGRIVKKFGIKQVPAVVRQPVGLEVIEIEEIVL